MPTLHLYANVSFVIWLKVRLQSNVEFTLKRILAVFMRSAIIPLKVNRFGWNLEHSDYIFGSCPWQIMGAICAVVTTGEPGLFIVR